MFTMKKLFSKEMPPLWQRTNSPSRIINYGTKKVNGDEGDGYAYYSIEVKPGHWNYDDLVNAMITAMYPADRMQAVVNNYLMDPDDIKYKEEFNVMQEWRRMSKETARIILHL